MTHSGTSVAAAWTARVVKFGAAGALAAGVALATSLVLYHVAAVPYMVSQAFGFVAGALVNYPLNRHWTYGNHYSRIAVQVAIFLLVSVAGLAVNELVLYVLAGIEHVWVPLAMASGLVGGFIWNFALHSILTFGWLS